MESNSSTALPQPVNATRLDTWTRTIVFDEFSKSERCVPTCLDLRDLPRDNHFQVPPGSWREDRCADFEGSYAGSDIVANGFTMPRFNVTVGEPGDGIALGGSRPAFGGLGLGLCTCLLYTSPSPRDS